MIKAVLNKLLMVLYFIFGALALEFITFRVLNLGTMPQYFMLNLSIIMAIGLFVYIIPNFTAQYVIYTLILLAQTIFLYLNYSLSYIYKDLFSMDMLLLIKEANRAMTANFVYISIILQLVAVFLSIAVFGLILLNFCKKEKLKIKYHYSIFSMIILLSTQFFACGYYVHIRSYINDMSDLSDVKYTESDAFLMNTNFLKTTSYSKFGTYGYVVNLCMNSFSTINNAHKVATVDYFNAGERYGEKDSDVFGVDKGNNVMVIMMESLEWFGFGDGSYSARYNNLSNELTPNIYSLIAGQDNSLETKQDNAMISKHFFAKSKTNISEGYGILGNYPVGEALSSFVGKDYDPSLNAFGYSLPNMLKKNNYVTNYVHSNVIGFYSRNLTHKNIGFDNLYGKDNILDEDDKPVYTGDDLIWDHWAPEGDFAKKALKYLVPETENGQPFFTFYLNVSSHGPYTAPNNGFDSEVIRYLDYIKYGEKNCRLVRFKGAGDDKYFLDENGEEITDLATLEEKYPDEFYAWELDEEKWKTLTTQDEKYTNFFKNAIENFGNYSEQRDEYSENELTEKLAYYMCGVKGLDDAIGVILNELERRGIADKTTLLLYADHYAYYDGLSNDIKGFDRYDTTSVELNTIPMILSSPGLKNKMKNGAELDYSVNERFCSAYDVIPTILDLLGVDFNQNFYVGRSLFKPADYVYPLDNPQYDMVVYYSNTGGFFSRDMFTIDFKNYYTSTGRLSNDSELQLVFRSEATNVLVKLNYLLILNKYHLYNEIKNK